MAEYTATSGSYKTILTVTETGTPDTSNNTSTVQFSLVLKKESGTGLWNSDECNWSININGTPYSGTFTYDFRSTESITLKSNTTQTIQHNDDGTKTISVSASVDMDNTPYVYTMSPSGTLTLSTIARASDVTVSNYSITNTTGSFSYTVKAKANFYHRAWWSINGYESSWVNLGQFNTDRTFYISNADILSKLPDKTSGSLTVYVQTCSNSSYSVSVGTKNASATISVNTTYIKPSLTLGDISLNYSRISGYAVAWYSKVQSAWSASGGYGTTGQTTYFTISSGTLTSYSSTETSGTVVSNWTTQSNTDYTLTLYAYTKDSRGAVSDTISKSIKVWGYLPPSASLSAYRVADATSTAEDGSGEYVYVSFGGLVTSSINGQNSMQSITCTYSGSISGTATNGGHYALNENQTVTFKLTVRDKVTTSTATVIVGPAYFPLDLYDDGNGVTGVGLGTIAYANSVTSPYSGYFGYTDADRDVYFDVGKSGRPTGKASIRCVSGAGGLTLMAGETGNSYSSWINASNASNSKTILEVSNTLKTILYGASESVISTPVRPTDADDFYADANDGGFRKALITSSMTTGTPKQQGHLMMLNWDGSDTYNAQIAVGYDGTYLAVRGQPLTDKAWTNWRYAEIAETIWTGTLLANNSQAIDMSSFSKIRIYAITWGLQHIFDIDLTISAPPHGVVDSGYPYQASSVTGFYSSANNTGTFYYYGLTVKVNSAKRNMWFAQAGYASTNGSWTMQNNNADYYVYRIDGIL